MKLVGEPMVGPSRRAVEWSRTARFKGPLLPSGYDFGYENRVNLCPLVSARIRSPRACI